MSKLDDIIRRFESNTATIEDLNWAIPILRRYADKSKRINQNRKTIDKPIYIPQPIDFTKTPALIKVLGNIRLIFTKKSICLESEGQIVAAKRDNKYYYIERTNLSKTEYDTELEIYTERVQKQKKSGLLSSKPGRIKKDGTVIPINQFEGKPILAEPNWTISATQNNHIKKFIGTNKKVTIPSDKFNGILERLSDSVTVSYSKKQSSLFWDLFNY